MMAHGTLCLRQKHSKWLTQPQFLLTQWKANEWSLNQDVTPPTRHCPVILYYPSIKLRPRYPDFYMMQSDVWHLWSDPLWWHCCCLLWNRRAVEAKSRMLIVSNGLLLCSHYSERNNTGFYCMRVPWMIRLFMLARIPLFQASTNCV